MKRSFALICAICVLLCGVLTGCKNNDYIAKVNGKDVAIGWYLANAVYTAAQMEQTYGPQNYITFLSQKNSVDPSRTNAQVLDDAAKNAFESNYAAKLLVNELGLSLDGIGKEAFDAEYDFYKKTFFNIDTFNRFLQLSHVTEEQHMEIYQSSSYFHDMLYDYYFDEEIGIDKYTDDTIREYYDKYTEFAMKHILFSVPTVGEDGAALSQEEIAQNKANAKQKAEDTLEKIKAGTLSFDEAMRNYSDDPDLAKYPEGYGWKEGDGVFPEVFTTAAKEMNVGDMKIYESDLGYHIMLELDIDKYYHSSYSIYEMAYTTEYINNIIQDYRMNRMTIEYNKSALNKYKFTNIGAPGITLLSLT